MLRSNKKARCAMRLNVRHECATWNISRYHHSAIQTNPLSIILFHPKTHEINLLHQSSHYQLYHLSSPLLYQLSHHSSSTSSLLFPFILDTILKSEHKSSSWEKNEESTFHVVLEIENTHLYTARLSASNCAWSIMFVFGDVGMLFSCILYWCGVWWWCCCCCFVLLLLMPSNVYVLASSMWPMPSRRYSASILLFGCWISMMLFRNTISTLQTFFVFRSLCLERLGFLYMFVYSCVCVCVCVRVSVYVRAILCIINWMEVAVQFWCNSVIWMAIPPKYRFILRWRARLIISCCCYCCCYHSNAHGSKNVYKEKQIIANI